MLERKSEFKRNYFFSRYAPNRQRVQWDSDGACSRVLFILYLALSIRYLVQTPPDYGQCTSLLEC
jgi:hypothetical protein